MLIWAHTHVMPDPRCMVGGGKYGTAVPAGRDTQLTCSNPCGRGVGWGLSSYHCRGLQKVCTPLLPHATTVAGSLYQLPPHPCVAGEGVLWWQSPAPTRPCVWLASQ